MSTTTVELSEAIDSLEQAMNLYRKASENSPEQKAFRDACIQRFEYSLEFAWKVSMKCLGSNVGAAKLAVREMARNNLISNPSEWIDFIEARNNTSHSYDEEVAKQVFKQIENFLPCARALTSELQKLTK